jgi:hypothetical protein
MRQHLDLAGLVIDLDVGDGQACAKAVLGLHLARLGIDGRERDQEDAAPGDGACPA